MIVWRITGNEIGPNGCGAAHFTTKAEAARALAGHREEAGPDMGSGPERIAINTREQLAAALDDAMSYGGS